MSPALSPGGLIILSRCSRISGVIGLMNVEDGRGGPDVVQVTGLHPPVPVSLGSFSIDANTRIGRSNVIRLDIRASLLSNFMVVESVAAEESLWRISEVDACCWELA